MTGDGPEADRDRAASPLASGAVGELFWQVAEAVMLVRDDRIIAWNPAATRLFGLTPQPDRSIDETLRPVLGGAYETLRPLVADGGSAQIDATEACGLVLEATCWRLTDSVVHVIMLRDVSAQVRLAAGLARLSELGRELLHSEPLLPDLLQQLVDEAKTLTRADFSALLVLRNPDSVEISHFVYNAPRELFPERLPRAVGLLAVPLSTRAPARLDDIRGHTAGVGIPVKHPPIGPLLAAPVLAGDCLLGEVAIANAPHHRRFDEVDEQLLTDLAAHAGIAIRWAESRAAAAMAAEARAEIIATARHDIRNPLTIGKGYVSMLDSRRERMSDEQVSSAIAAIRLAFERIEEFASRALIDEHVPIQGETPDWAEVDVPSLVGSLAADHMTANREAGVRVVTVIEPDTPETFMGDAGMVREILDNLVSNAIKYGAPGSPVTVTVRIEGEQVRFDVHNMGEGIPVQEHDALFERYWRSGRVRDGAIPGSGLGLSIVRRLVELHHGLVGVTSRPEEGTTFWVTFPRVVPTPREAESQSRSNASSSVGSAAEGA